MTEESNPTTLPPVVTAEEVKPEPGKLSPTQIEQAKAWLQTKWGPGFRPCPWHAEPNKWEINPYFGQVPGYDASALIAYSGRSFPALVITCTVCGFMVPINAIRAGVIPADPPEVHAAAGEAE